MYQQSHLQHLEAEAIFIIREVAACFDNPCMFYSIGKDSTVMLHLARKAFWLAPVQFTLLHVDTTWEFPEMGRFRDYMAAKHNLNILVHVNNSALANGIHPISSGSVKYNDQMKTQALKQAMNTHKFDAALGGARRDEEKSRAKERIFSVRDEHQGWNPKNQRPELWNTFNTEINKGESIRVFPLSNWTELDIWQYILREKIELVSLYFSAPRLSWKSEENGQYFVLGDDRMLPFLSEKERQSITHRTLRCRTLGCYPQTGAILSTAVRVEDIIQELLVSKTSEREGRTLDKDQVGSMEKKKREGYF